jgi:hypothetical protein
VADGVSVLVEFKAFRIEEEIGVYSRELVDLPPEEITFPPWYGDQYRSTQIGGLYSYLFGTGAITDPTTILAPNGEAQAIAQIENEVATADRSLSLALEQTFSQLTRDAITGGVSGPQPEFGDVPQEAGQDIGPPGTPESAANQDALAQVPTRSTLSIATEEIVKAYSLVRLNKYSVDEFLRAYVWRPVASAVDILGSANLEINDDGEVVRGVEGFHSRAFGDYDDLRTLVGPGDGDRPQTILGLTTRDPDEARGDSTREARDEKISQRMDTRKEKRLPVLRYLYSLMAQRGVVG